MGSVDAEPERDFNWKHQQVQHSGVIQVVSEEHDREAVAYIIGDDIWYNEYPHHVDERWWQRSVSPNYPDEELDGGSWMRFYTMPGGGLVWDMPIYEEANKSDLAKAAQVMKDFEVPEVTTVHWVTDGYHDFKTEALNYYDLLK